MLLRSQSLPTSADNTSDGRPGFKPTTTTHPHSPVSPSPPGEPLQPSPEAHGQSTLRPEDSSQHNSTFPTPVTYVAYNHYAAMFRQAQQGQQWKAQAAECRTLLNMFAKKIIELDRKTRANISEALDTWTDDDRAKLVDKISVLEQENLIQSRQIMVLQENQTYLSNRLQSLTDDMVVISRKHYCDRKAWEQTLNEKENTLRESQRLLGESALTYSQYRNLLRKYQTESAQLNEAVQQSDWDHVVYIIRRMGTGKRS
ncbi:hypothetical protein IWQ61_008057 [Dispira simplex]|nr:hypothetical protein IWQ61_008057 [Dispira simplex]